ATIVNAVKEVFVKTTEDTEKIQQAQLVGEIDNIYQLRSKELDEQRKVIDGARKTYKAADPKTLNVKQAAALEKLTKYESWLISIEKEIDSSSARLIALHEMIDNQNVQIPEMDIQDALAVDEVVRKQKLIFETAENDRKSYQKAFIAG